MSTGQVMIGWRAEFTDGSVKSGTVGVPASNAENACRRVVGAIRSQYGHAVEDVSCAVLGPA
jgi:hypothetical protein